MQKKPFYLQTKEEVFIELQSSEQGIPQSEVQNRIEKYGKNVVSLKQKHKGLIFFLSQFKDILAIVLIGAGILGISFGDYQTGTVLFAIVLINSIIGFIQEFQAEKIISKLSNLINPKTIVIRDGKEKEILSSELVPGDVVYLNEGDSITADLRVIKSNKLQVNSFSITGESNPQHKTDTVLRESTALADQTNMIFTGSTVAVGNGHGIVTATGMNSEFGKIATLSHETKEELSPLQFEINNLAKRATTLSLFVGVIMLIIGFTLLKLGTIDAVLFSIGIAAAMVPEGLPAEVNVALSLGARRLALKNAVVRKLSSVETLGATTFICSDKTGTLTKNEMTVEKIWLPGQAFSVKGLGYEGIGEILPEEKKELAQLQKKIFQQFLECGFFSSNARIGLPDKDHPTYYVAGDPTEGAIIALAKKGNIDMKKIDEEHPEIDEIPFDSDRKMMSSIRKYDKEILVFAKGAPVLILNKCTKFRDIDGNEKELSKEDRENIYEKIKQYADQAYRVLSFAYRKIDQKEEYTTENTEKEFVFMGIIAIIDPPREGVAEAINAAHNAHIKTIIITGDAPSTAIAIAKKIHLNKDSHEKIFCVTGADLDNINDQTLLQWLKENKSAVFSRVSPEQKLRIVGLLKDSKEIVAVTGDGVNDAPALKKAHIGIAMGKIGTEVAKEAAKIVLADDSFVTLVTAIREGRVIYANLKKTITACFTSNFGELSGVTIGLFGTYFLGIPLALIPIHILFIDLLGEILPLMALTYDSPTSDVMTEKPRDMNKHALSVKQIADIAISGFFMGLAGYVAYLIFLTLSGQNFESVDVKSILYREATTITYVTIVFSQWWNVLLRRLGTQTVFNKYFFTNRMLWLSYAISLILVLLVIYTPFMNNSIKTAGLSIKSWGIVIFSSICFMLIMEIKKAIQRKV